MQLLFVLRWLKRAPVLWYYNTHNPQYLKVLQVLINLSKTSHLVFPGIGNLIQFQGIVILRD